MTAATRRTGSRQVLELASGLTLRGLDFTQDPRYTYIESDLTGITAEKKAIIASLRLWASASPPIRDPIR